MKNKTGMYVIIILLLLSIDQLTKEAMKKLANGVVGYSMRIFGDFFRLTYVENRGGIFGVFQGSIAIFTVLSLVLIALVVYSEYKNFYKYDELTRIGIVFIASGALGNMTDRLFRTYVIDMLDFNAIWKFIFNMADVYIHLGLYIIIISSIIKNIKKEKRK